MFIFMNLLFLGLNNLCVRILSLHYANHPWCLLINVYYIIIWHDFLVSIISSIESQTHTHINSITNGIHITSIFLKSFQLCKGHCRIFIADTYVRLTSGFVANQATIERANRLWSWNNTISLAYSFGDQKQKPSKVSKGFFF